MLAIRSLQQRYYILLIVGVIFIALILRIWGNTFGLPYEYHVDEVQYVRQAATMGESGLRPTWWNNPPFLKYIYLAEFGGLYVFGKLLGWYGTIAEFGAQNSLDPTSLYLLARSTTAVLGTITVLLIYFLGKTGYDRRTGLIAAVFLSISYIHVRDSHFATNDIAVTLLSTAIILFSLKIADSGERRWYVLSGTGIGLAFATKYTGVFAALPVFIAHFLTEPGRNRDQKYPFAVDKLLFFLAAAIFSTVLASPYFVLTPQEVIEDVYNALFMAGRYGFDGWDIDPSGSYIYYLKSLSWGLGWLLLAISIAGLGRALWRRTKTDLILLSYVLIYFLILGSQQMYFARFLLPVVPIILVLAAAFIGSLISRLMVDFSVKIRAITMIAAITIIILQPAIWSSRFIILLSKTDTRTVAKEWVEANIPADSKIATDWPFYGPPLATSEKPTPFSSRYYDVLLVGGIGLPTYTIEWYIENDFDYLIVSDFISSLERSSDEENIRRENFYQNLIDNFEIVKIFSPMEYSGEGKIIFDSLYSPANDLWWRTQPGPTITIYSLST